MDDLRTLLHAALDWHQQACDVEVRGVLNNMVASPASREEIRSAWALEQVPASLTTAWRAARSCRLFEDVGSSTSGFVLLSPDLSAAVTSELRQSGDTYLASDYVVGELLGPTELLVYSSADRALRTAMRCKSRSQWPRVAPDLPQFIAQWILAAGRPWWAPQRSRPGAFGTSP